MAEQPTVFHASLAPNSPPHTEDAVPDLPDSKSAPTFELTTTSAVPVIVDTFIPSPVKRPASAHARTAHNRKADKIEISVHTRYKSEIDTFESHLAQSLPRKHPSIVVAGVRKTRPTSASAGGSGNGHDADSSAAAHTVVDNGIGPFHGVEWSNNPAPSSGVALGTVSFAVKGAAAPVVAPRPKSAAVRRTSLEHAAPRTRPLSAHAHHSNEAAKGASADGQTPGVGVGGGVTRWSVIRQHEWDDLEDLTGALSPDEQARAALLRQSQEESAHLRRPAPPMGFRGDSRNYVGDSSFFNTGRLDVDKTVSAALRPAGATNTEKELQRTDAAAMASAATELEREFPLHRRPMSAPAMRTTALSGFAQTVTVGARRRGGPGTGADSGGSGWAPSGREAGDVVAVDDGDADNEHASNNGDAGFDDDYGLVGSAVDDEDETDTHRERWERVDNNANVSSPSPASPDATLDAIADKYREDIARGVAVRGTTTATTAAAATGSGSGGGGVGGDRAAWLLSGISGSSLLSPPHHKEGLEGAHALNASVSSSSTSAMQRWLGVRPQSASPSRWLLSEGKGTQPLTMPIMPSVAIKCKLQPFGLAAIGSLPFSSVLTRERVDRVGYRDVSRSVVAAVTVSVSHAVVTVDRASSAVNTQMFPSPPGLSESEDEGGGGRVGKRELLSPFPTPKFNARDRPRSAMQLRSSWARSDGDRFGSTSESKAQQQSGHSPASVHGVEPVRVALLAKDTTVDGPAQIFECDPIDDGEVRHSMWQFEVPAAEVPRKFVSRLKQHQDYDGRIEAAPIVGRPPQISVKTKNLGEMTNYLRLSRTYISAAHGIATLPDAAATKTTCAASRLGSASSGSGVKRRPSSASSVVSVKSLRRKDHRALRGNDVNDGLGLHSWGAINAWGAKMSHKDAMAMRGKAKADAAAKAQADAEAVATAAAATAAGVATPVSPATRGPARRLFASAEGGPSEMPAASTSWPSGKAMGGGPRASEGSGGALSSGGGGSRPGHASAEEGGGAGGGSLEFVPSLVSRAKEALATITAQSKADKPANVAATPGFGLAVAKKNLSHR